jgi:hypothetical protein
VAVGVEGPGGGEERAQALRPTVRRRLATEVQVPKLPNVPAPTAPVPLANVILAAGVETPEGFVPLGLTAAPDRAAEGDAADGIVTPTIEEGSAPGRVPLRVSPRHSGLERHPWKVLAFATTLEKLDLPADEPPSDFNASRRLVSALVQPVGEIRYAPEAPPVLAFEREFLGFDARPTLTGRRFEQGAAEPRTTLHRLSIGDRTQGEWYVWFGETATPAAFEIPAPPEGFEDRFAKPLFPGSEIASRVRLESIALERGATAFDEIVAPGGATLDELGEGLSAFTVREIVH